MPALIRSVQLSPKSSRLRFVLLVALGLAVIAIGTTVVLLSREDRGFIRSECYQDSGPHEIMFRKSDQPVLVRFEPEAEDWRASVVLASRWWEDRVGRPLFKIGGVLRAGEMVGDPVIVVGRTNAADHGAARILWDKLCLIQRVELSLPGTAPEEFWEKIARHELGHALGLDHDDYEESAMYPTVNQRTADVLTNEDKERLK